MYNVKVRFDWDGPNTAHIARHGIRPQEAEEAISLDPLEVDLQDVEGESRVLCFGRTSTGRLLTVVYTERRGGVRVVTAYEMTKQQQLLYFKGR